MSKIREWIRNSGGKSVVWLETAATNTVTWTRNTSDKSRINPHGVLAIVLLIVTWGCWYTAPWKELESAASAAAKPALQASALGAAADESSDAPPSADPGEKRQERSLQITYGWYLACASLVYVLLVIFSAERIAHEKRPRTLARHRVACGGHIFMVLAGVALLIRTEVQSTNPNDYYVFSFVVALSLGIAAPFLLWRTTAEEE